MWATFERTQSIMCVELLSGVSLSPAVALTNYNDPSPVVAINDVRGFMEGGVLKYLIVVYKEQTTVTANVISGN